VRHSSSRPDSGLQLVRMVSLLALNGLRVSEAIGADIEALGLERGHRTHHLAQGWQRPSPSPLAPRSARAVDLPSESARASNSKIIDTIFFQEGLNR